jgi:hypothetical protein
MEDEKYSCAALSNSLNMKRREDASNHLCNFGGDFSLEKLNNLTIWPTIQFFFEDPDKVQTGAGEK